jgi:hypothetical protein
MAWKWKPLTLPLLFGGKKPPLPLEEVDAESRPMEALTELEDEQPDDGRYTFR